ncbi:MAG: hypothetical protein Q9220_003263 [cf. Caloplaca sp. 1 TL-2023]
MKSRQASPQPELVQLRTWRLNSSSEPPTLQLSEISELFQSNMGLNNLGGFSLDTIPSSPHQNGIASDGVVDTPRATSPVMHDTPYRPSLANSRRFHSQPLSDAKSTEPASPIPAVCGTPNGDLQDSPWSSAVGRATTGKSGRVIERLMAENDRLRREKNLVDVRWEEEIKRSESARSAMEGLKSTNENLTTIHESGKSMLAKRERKLEEMKSELELERQKRERAEAETRETRRERDDAVESLRKDLQIAREQAKRATTQYDVMSRSFKSLEENYSRQTRKLKVEMKSLGEDVAADQQKMVSLHTVLEHFRSASERSHKVNDQLQQTFDTYKSTAEQELKGIREAARHNDQRNDQMQHQMQDTMNQMRYVMNVQQNVSGLK